MEPLVKCGGTSKRTHKPCRKPAGWRTDHPGVGNCHFHGGSTPIKSGRYSSIKRDTLREKVEQFEADPDPLNLAPEVALLRAFTVDLIERFDEIYGPDGALLAWHESFRNPDSPAQPKPRQMPDFSAVTSVVDKVGAMVDRIQKHKAEGSISLVTLNRYVEQLGAELIAAVQETKLDADSSTKLLDAVERRWATVRLDAGKPGRSRSEEGAAE
jgi:uncharacterized protein YejL (UPF0352 family)